MHACAPMRTSSASSPIGGLITVDILTVTLHSLHELTTCGREVYGCKGNRRYPDDDTLPYFDCGGGYTNLYM